MRKFRVGALFGFTCGILVGICIPEIVKDCTSKKRGVIR